MKVLKLTRMDGKEFADRYGIGMAPVYVPFEKVLYFQPVPPGSKLAAGVDYVDLPPKGSMLCLAGWRDGGGTLYVQETCDQIEEMMIALGSVFAESSGGKS